MKNKKEVVTLGSIGGCSKIRVFSKENFKKEWAHGYVKECKNENGEIYYFVHDDYGHSTYEEQQEFLSEGYIKYGYPLKTK